MKIERINENQIRCTLSNFDLSVRNMNLGELAYGSEKARSLFREMIQRAANEVGFEAEECVSILLAIRAKSCIILFWAFVIIWAFRYPRCLRRSSVIQDIIFLIILISLLDIRI